MGDTNKLAKEWYKVTYQELATLMNQHYQISQVDPLNGSLAPLAARIRRVAACCETWKVVARCNAVQKFFKGG